MNLIVNEKPGLKIHELMKHKTRKTDNEQKETGLRHKKDEGDLNTREMTHCRHDIDNIVRETNMGGT